MRLLGLGLVGIATANMDWTLDRGAADYHIIHQLTSTSDAAMGYTGIADQNFDHSLNQASSFLDSSKLQIKLEHISLPDQINGTLNVGVLRWSQDNFSIGSIVLSQDFGQLQGYDANGNSTGSFNAGSTLIGLDLGYLWHDCSIGYRGSWFRQNISDASSNAFLSDIYFHANLPYGLASGIAARNLGWGSPFDQREIFEPLEAQWGLSWSWEWFKNFNTRIEADYRYRNDEGWAIPLGTELSFYHILKIRGGVEIKDNDYSPTTGFGVEYLGFGVDYSIVLRSYIGNENRFSLKASF